MIKPTAPVIYSLATLLILLAGLARAQNAPTEIAGFRLGEDITEYSEIEYGDYLKEVVINDWHGFRKGIISYGTCAYPGKIVKMRMKYEDSSKAFYEELLDRLKKRYGKPDQWEGDAFGILYVWKWRFTDENGLQVNMILQHNLHQHEENIGNMVKLSYPERDEEERLCFIEYCEANKSPEERERIKQRMDPDWDYMIPR